MDLTGHVFINKHRDKLTDCLKNSGSEDENVCPIYELAGHGFVLLMRVDTVRQLVVKLNKIIIELEFIRSEIKHTQEGENSRSFYQHLKNFDDTITAFVDIYFDDGAIVNGELDETKCYDQEGLKMMVKLSTSLTNLKSSLRELQDDFEAQKGGLSSSTRIKEYHSLKDINKFFETRMQRLIKSSIAARKKVFSDENFTPNDIEYKQNLLNLVAEVAQSADIHRESAFNKNKNKK